MTTQVTPARRSRRARKSNTRFDDQVEWNDDTLRLLRADSDSSDRSSKSSLSEGAQKEVDPDVGDVVMQDVGQARNENPPDDDGETSIVATPDEDLRDLEGDVGGSSRVSTRTPRNTPRKIAPRQSIKADAVEKGLRNRMLSEEADLNIRLNKERFYPTTFGPELEDLYPIVQSRDIWHLKRRDVVLPSRTSLKKALELEVEGKYLRMTRNRPDEHGLDVSSLSKNNLPPIVIGDGPDCQAAHLISWQEAIDRRYIGQRLPNEVVVGPWNESQKHKLELNTPLDIAQAWASAQKSFTQLSKDTPSIQHPTTQPSSQQSGQQRSKNALEDPPKLSSLRSEGDQMLPSNANHRGWIFDVGACVQHLAWAPKKSDIQYLAIAVKCPEAQRSAAAPRESKLAPAFSPSSAFPSHIQIWTVKALTGEPMDPARLGHGNDFTPQLHLNLCMKWGNIVKFEWLPLSDPTVDTGKQSMVILSSEGSVRIIAVDLDNTGYLELDTPQLIASPPSHTVFTSFCLPSHEDLIAGGADGAVYLYTLNMPDANGNITPYVTVQIHNTYIMNTVVASDYPHFLATTYASGDFILTDLRSPSQDRVHVHKSRLPTRNLAYIPHVRTFLSTHDASGNSEPNGTSMGTVIAQSLRRFYHTNTLFKLPEASGVATVLAASPFHPIVLVANAAGSVFASNVLRKILPTGLKDERGGGFLAKLYEIDWVPLPIEKLNGNASHKLDSVNNDTSTTENNKSTYRFIPDPDTGEQERQQVDTEPDKVDLFYGSDPRPGITRFHEGFKPEHIELAAFGRQKPTTSQPKIKVQDKNGDVMSPASFQVIWNEEQAVTAMAWNGNSRFAGWAAIGWGSGLVRVQDLSHDVE